MHVQNCPDTSKLFLKSLMFDQVVKLHVICVKVIVPDPDRFFIYFSKLREFCKSQVCT